MQFMVNNLLPFVSTCAGPLLISLQGFFLNIIYLWLPWVIVAACAFPLVVAREELLSSSSSWCFLLRWLLLLQSSDSRVHKLRVMMHGLHCPTACGILTDQGLNLSLTLVGRFLTSGPPGNSSPRFE